MADAKTVSGILQSQAGLVAFLDAVRMLVVLFLLGIEKVMVQLCIDGIAQALLVEGFYIGMQLYASFGIAGLGKKFLDT